jgi:sec-independent protein translocase protein TatA
MGALKPWHIIVLVVVLLLLFGAKRLPDAARGLGRSLRIFKSETKGLLEDDVRGKAEAQADRQPYVEDRVTEPERVEPAPPTGPMGPTTPTRPPVVESRVVDSRDER